MDKKNFFNLKMAEDIGKILGVDFKKIDLDQFRKGMDEELEHGIFDSNTNVSNNDPIITGRLALAHLNKIPDYYDRLEKMKIEALAYRRGEKDKKVT